MGLEEFLTRVPRPPVALPPTPPPGAAAAALTKVGQAAGAVGAVLASPEAAVALVIAGPLSLLLETPTANDNALLRRRNFDKENDALQKNLDEKRQVQDEYNKFMERVLNHPGEPAIELEKAKYPFHGGQDAGRLYEVNFAYELESTGDTPINPSARYQVGGAILDGPVIEIHAARYMSEYGSATGIFITHGVPLRTDQFAGNITTSINYINARITKITPRDGKPDNTDPHPATPPITTKPGQDFVPILGNGPLPDVVQSASGAGAVVGIGGTAVGMGLGAGDWAANNPIPDDTQEIPKGGGVIGFNDTTTEQTPTLPRTNTGTEPTASTKDSVPAILIGPASVPGSITTTKAFEIPVGGQNITTSKVTGTPEVETKPTETPISTTTVHPTITDIEQIKRDIQKLSNPTTGLAPIVAGAVLTAPIIKTIENNTTRNAIATAAEEGTCNSFKPGRCNAGIAQNIGDIAGNAVNNNTLLRNLSDILGAGNQALIPAIWNDVRTLNTKVGDVTGIGSVGKFLSGLSDWSGISRIMDAITMVAAVHNALMLSNNIEHTLFQIIDNVVSIPTLIVNPKAESVNSEKVVGDLVSSFFKSILGTQGWAALQSEWKALNTINSTAANIHGNIQSIVGDTQTIQNITNEWVAQLGNALQNEGVIGDDNWTPKPDKPHFRSKALAKLEGMANGIQQVDTALQSIEAVTQALLDVVQQGNQIKNNLGELNKAKDEAVEAAKKLYDAEIDKIKLPDFDIDDLF